MPCMCGDSECPSCGLAQGTLTQTDVRSVTVRKREWYRKHLIDARSAARLERALRTLADYETEVKFALLATHGEEKPHANVCAALRYLVDGWEG